MSQAGQLRGAAVVGAADHADSAVLVTVADDGGVVDRRRITLVDPGLPVYPYHHEGRRLPAAEAVRLVERVRASADRNAAASLDALAASVPVAITGIALRTIPPLPSSVADRIADYRAQNVADSAMYRQALADAAASRGWRVSWYDPRTLFAGAAAAAGLATIEERVREAGKVLGRPWRKDHRVAMAAAIAAAKR